MKFIRITMLIIIYLSVIGCANHNLVKINVGDLPISKKEFEKSIPELSNSYPYILLNENMGPLDDKINLEYASVVNQIGEPISSKKVNSHNREFLQLNMYGLLAGLIYQPVLIDVISFLIPVDISWYYLNKANTHMSHLWKIGEIKIIAQSFIRDFDGSKVRAISSWKWCENNEILCALFNR